MKIPRVFISYSWDSNEHAKRVWELTNRLRHDGIDCIFDQDDDSVTGPQETWPVWMDRGIRDSDFVVIIFTEKYFKRITGKEKKGIGKGAKFEGKLIICHIYRAEASNTKFIPCVFNEKDKQYILELLSGNNYSLDKEQDYDTLKRRLIETGEFINPPAPLHPKSTQFRPVLTTTTTTTPEPESQVALSNVPGLPRYYLPRQKRFADLKAAVLSKKKQTIGLVGVLGMGGVGKTVMASALAHDEKIQKGWYLLADHRP